ncbi:hypothetical protein BKA70DRAFT_566736 [Coprinopsis sp. MPI-PUGE-AT-0042]|nr:hypothetical protein BKA70DRAFT_566736 [Coprinopsis sp. MPI-PUGE-AT-0042]
MALSTSPRKTIPLATGDEPSRSQLTLQPSVTKRVFYCGVVVEGSEHGRRLPEEIQELVLSLGKHLGSEEEDGMLSRGPEGGADVDQGTQRKRALTDTSALTSVVNELVTSERSYVHRLNILKKDYADPLRNFARSKDTAIIPPYEAKVLFGNVDNLIPVNQAFLEDLDKMLASDGPTTVGGIGDVALKHFKDLQGFEQYKQYYVKREEAQRIFEREIAKRGSRFGNYIDHIKYQSTDSKNRIGLRELLMEPVQRIPRYTLLFRTILKHMSPDDPQRAKLIEADEIASKIAQAEADEQTKRAAIFYCLSTTVEGFPPDLFSFQRKFIDCIDVEDVIGEGPLFSATSSGGNASTLHCTLFLFDDKLVIVKRSNGEKAGRSLAGLDDLDRLTKGAPSMIKKRTGLSCKGVVEIVDVTASDPGGPDIHLFLENPPQDQSDRWSGRAFRSLSVVLPPGGVNLDPIQTESAKRRFLENLWLAQAMYRARQGQSVVLCSEDQQVEHKGNRTTYARTYYNVYTRTSFLQEPKKTKVVVHIDPLGSADPIPFGMGCSPILRIRVQPMAGSVCRLVAQSFDPEEPGDDDVIRSDKVDKWIIDTIHRFGLFTFRANNSISAPPTPTARSRANRFGLDTISRNLFNGRPASAMGDLFGGSINGHKRAKSTTTTSRSSTYTATTATTDSLFKSNRSQSTTRTSVDDSESVYSSRSSKRGKLRKEYSESDAGSLGRSFLSRSFRSSKSFARSRSRSTERSEDLSDRDGDEDTVMTNVDTNDDDLAMQLELAKKNSLNQDGNGMSQIELEAPDDSIYEDEPPQPVTRPTSRASGDGVRRSTTPRPGREGTMSPVPSERDSRPHSRLSERRPLGPRAVSPNPFASASSPTTFELRADVPNYGSDDDDELFEMEMVNKTPSRRSQPSGIPRSRRIPFLPADQLDSTPKPATSSADTASAAATKVEPLSIKKKTSIRGPAAASSHSPTPTRRIFARTSPTNTRVVRATSPRKASPQTKRPRGFSAPTLPIKLELVDDVLRMAGATKTEIEQSLRLIKRIKADLESQPRSNQSPTVAEDSPRAASPDKTMRTPPVRNQPLTREAQQRMEEMQRLLGHRANASEGVVRPRIRAGSIFEVPSASPGTSGPSGQMLRSLAAILGEADQCLTRASANQDKLERGIHDVTGQYKEKLVEQERMRLELQQSKRQTELVKELLADATAEKEIMYEAFNEELDAMYSDINLPDEEDALAALTKDLKVTKESRNQLSQENAQLKRRLAEAELQNAAWGDMLRQHGLIA